MKKILIVSLCFLLVVGCGCNKKEEVKEEAPFEVNFELAKEKEIDGLKISNIQVIKDEKGMSNYTATVTNTTDNIYKLNQINMIIKDKKGNKITTLVGYIGSNISSNESRTLTINTDINIMNGYEIEYEIKK